MNEDKAFQFIRTNIKTEKPRKTGLTEIRGPYYSVMGQNYLTDILRTMGEYIDSLKFAGGSFTLLPREELKAMIDLCHNHNVLVSTGGYIEKVLTQGEDIVELYLKECQSLGFDIIELSAGFVSFPIDHWLFLVQKVQKLGMKAKPEVGVQFGAGGGSAIKELANEDLQSSEWAIHKIKRFIEAGAYLIMIESEGITESVNSWRTDVPAKIASAVGLEKIMFEASDPAVFSWYIKNYGPEVNLFVDHSQIVQLECLRSGIWGTKDTWGKIVTYREK